MPLALKNKPFLIKSNQSIEEIPSSAAIKPVFLETTAELPTLDPTKYRNIILFLFFLPIFFFFFFF